MLELELEKLKNTKYETFNLHSELLIVGIKNKQTIGYVAKHKEEEYWFWFMGQEFSTEKFITSDDAVSDLIRKFVAFKYDSISKKLGIFNNEDYTKR